MRLPYRDIASDAQTGNGHKKILSNQWYRIKGV